MLPDRTLDGRVAIITGGGTGIGRAIALEYARLGARLVLASRSPEHLEPAAEELRATFGAEVLTAPTDVRVPEQVERLCEETVRRFGSIDILVNNAAGNFFCPAEKLSPNGWQTVVNIVLNGTFYCSRAAGLRMIAGGRGGNILNLVAAAEATKALAAGLHVMLFSDNVPVADEVRLKRLARERGLLALGPDCGTAILGGVPLGFANAVPRGRIGTPEEIAQASAYLVSDFADFITGEVLVMDGGQWLGKGMFGEGNR